MFKGVLIGVKYREKMRECENARMQECENTGMRECVNVASRVIPEFLNVVSEISGIPKRRRTEQCIPILSKKHGATAKVCPYIFNQNCKKKPTVA